MVNTQRLEFILGNGPPYVVNMDPVGDAVVRAWVGAQDVPPQVAHAVEVLKSPYRRAVLEAALVSGASLVAIQAAIGVPPEVSQIVASLILDPGVMRDAVATREWLEAQIAQADSSPDAQQRVAWLCVARDYGPDYVLQEASGSNHVPDLETMAERIAAISYKRALTGHTQRRADPRHDDTVRRDTALFLQSARAAQAIRRDKVRAAALETKADPHNQAVGAIRLRDPAAWEASPPAKPPDLDKEEFVT